VSVEIDWLAPERVPELQRFIDERWRRGHVLARDEELLRWQHRSLARPDCLAVLGATLAGDLVGMLGLVEFEACLGERRGRGAWMTTWLVVPERRGEGLGAALVEKACSENDLVGALDANDATRRVLAGSGFVERPILRWACVFDPAGLRELLGGRDPDWGKPTHAAPAEQLTGACRDDAFLSWRYRDHPRFEYRVLRRDGGLAAYRIEQVRDSEARVVRVVDFLGGEALALEVVEAGREAGVLFADFSCASAPFGAPLEAAGFRPAHSLPSRFQPLDLSERPSVSCFWAAPGIDVDLASDDLYVTAADSDLDRPNE
jgi:GNAT superfamily N-acetyltransferase